ncbi:MAG: hypothetical protein OET44_18740 [Gammaproteobacteria bacterium]|nr:hypothetical protein [Gammaproteobacteria bacterium]
MRLLISALCLAFAIGGSAWADCSSSSHGKKNDFETPPPVVLIEQNEIKK